MTNGYRILYTSMSIDTTGCIGIRSIFLKAGLCGSTPVTMLTSETSGQPFQGAVWKPMLSYAVASSLPAHGDSLSVNALACSSHCDILC